MRHLAGAWARRAPRRAVLPRARAVRAALARRGCARSIDSTALSQDRPTPPRACGALRHAGAHTRRTGGRGGGERESGDRSPGGMPMTASAPSPRATRSGPALPIASTRVSGAQPARPERLRPGRSPAARPEQRRKGRGREQGAWRSRGSTGKRAREAEPARSACPPPPRGRRVERARPTRVEPAATRAPRRPPRFQPAPRSRRIRRCIAPERYR